MKILKPMIKDPEPNKYVLEVVKSLDPGHAPFGACQRSCELLFKIWNHCITFERKKLDTSFFFFVRSAIVSTTQQTLNDE